MNKSMFAAAALLMAVTSASAGNGPGTHLEPENYWTSIDNPWDTTRITRAVFSEAFGPDVILRMHESGSMIVYENMVFLKHNGGTPAIVALHTDRGFFE